jgi:hypothetical protein
MATTIVTDLDGVLVDSVQCMLNWVLHRYGVAVPKATLQGYKCEPYVHEFLQSLDQRLYPMVPKDETLDQFSALVLENCWRNAEFYMRCPPHYVIYTALHNWAHHFQDPDSLIGLTSRPYNLGIHQATLRWCALWDLKGMPIVHPQHKQPRSQKELNSKAAFIANLLEHRSKVLYLEDAPEFVLAVAEHNHAAIQGGRLNVVCVDRPWNNHTGLAHGAMRCGAHVVAQLIQSLIHEETVKCQTTKP